MESQKIIRDGLILENIPIEEKEKEKTDSTTKDQIQRAKQQSCLTKYRCCLISENSCLDDWFWYWYWYYYFSNHETNDVTVTDSNCCVYNCDNCDCDCCCDCDCDCDD